MKQRPDFGPDGIESILVDILTDQDRDDTLATLRPLVHAADTVSRGWDWRVNVCDHCIARLRHAGGLQEADVGDADPSAWRCFVCGEGERFLRLPGFEVMNSPGWESKDCARLMAQCNKCGTLYLGAKGTYVLCPCSKPMVECGNEAVSKVRWCP